jgi:hypothetical protein
MDKLEADLKARHLPRTVQVRGSSRQAHLHTLTSCTREQVMSVLGKIRKVARLEKIPLDEVWRIKERAVALEKLWLRQKD